MQRILLAYDGGEPARRALQAAIDCARAFSASVSVVSVVPYRPATSDPVEPWDDSAHHAGLLIEARDRLREEGIEPDLFEPIGDPARTIERIAREGGYDTVIMGSRGLGAIDRMLQGSVSEHVVTHAGGTILITH